MSRLSKKDSGAYFSPEDVVQTLTRWAVRRASDRMLDPSCGDGRFLALHKKSVGVEQDALSAAEAIKRAPWALVHEGDFFEWAQNTKERFECAAGNPPFIRYQKFRGELRDRAMSHCRTLGANFSGLASSWAPFLVATAALLKEGGRMAFIIPAEIGHAPYSSPLVSFLIRRFNVVHVIAVREKLFPQLSEDCWLLFADGYGGSSESIRFTTLDRFEPMETPPEKFLSVSTLELEHHWEWRLRPYLLPARIRELYSEMAAKSDTRRMSDVANVGIGYVTGENDFFHFNQSGARSHRIPEQFLFPTVRNGRALPENTLTKAEFNEWAQADSPVFLLRLPRSDDLPKSVQNYLDSSAGREARTAEKCQQRKQFWYSVPDVQVPSFFMSYMSGIKPSLVRNVAGCSCTNSVHAVRLNGIVSAEWLAARWQSPFVQLSCELEGHPLGGGMLKLEPGEAQRVILPERVKLHAGDFDRVQDALTEMRRWRHYAS